MKKIILIVATFIILTGCNSNKRDWEKARQINTVKSYQEYLTTHPSGDYAQNAKLLIDSLDMYTWPPQKQSTVPPAFIETPTISFKDWMNVKIEESERMAFYAKNAKIKLKDNIFSITKPSNGFIENQFEVVYFDDKQTFIVADSTKNDKLVFVYLGPGNLKETYTFPGMKVRYQNKIFELRADGWYINNKRIHAF
jgi:hypothetical protein